MPVACADGYYSAEGATACSICPAGSYCPGPPRDEASKATCAAGTYSENGASSCSSCPMGHYCPDTTQPPEPCAVGYYADVADLTECIMYVSPSWYLALFFSPPVFQLCARQPCRRGWGVPDVLNRGAFVSPPIFLPSAPTLLFSDLFPDTGLQVHCRQRLPIRSDAGATMPSRLLQRRPSDELHPVPRWFRLPHHHGSHPLRTRHVFRGPR